MTHDPSRRSPGPFLPEQIRSGDPYELSKGHPIRCNPTGNDGAGPNGLGFAVLNSDPMVKSAGVDPGIDLGGRTLRAPDVGVGIEAGPGTWFKSAALALEYAGAGQDEAELRTKISELLEGGTRWVWVVRLTGPRRVEVHERGASVRVAGADEELTAPGVLELPVPVRALFDRDAAERTELRNLLKKQGYDGLDGVRREAEQMSSERWRAEGHAEGHAEGLAEGRDQGRTEVFTRLIERRLKRALTGDERTKLRERLREQGPDEVEALALDASREELVAWLAKPGA